MLCDKCKAAMQPCAVDVVESAFFSYLHHGEDGVLESTGNWVDDAKAAFIAGAAMQPCAGMGKDVLIEMGYQAVMDAPGFPDADSARIYRAVTIATHAILTALKG